MRAHFCAARFNIGLFAIVLLTSLLSCKASFRNVGENAVGDNQGADTGSDVSVNTNTNDDNSTADPRTITFTANGSPGALSVDAGTDVTISWATTGYDSCEIKKLSKTGLSGSHILTSINADATYTLDCDGPNGKGSKDLDIKLKVAPQGPTVDLKINGSDGPLTVAYNDDITLTWTSTGATTCALNTGAAIGLSGSRTITDVQATMAYELTCAANGVTSIDTVAVNVTPPTAPTVQFRINSSAGPLYVDKGTNLNLVWSSVNTTSCVVNPGGFTQLADNRTVNNIQTSTTYTILCNGLGGLTASHTIEVYLNGEVTGTLDLKVNNQDGVVPVNYLSDITVTWTSQNASSCEVVTTAGKWATTTGSQVMSAVSISQTILLVCQFNGGRPQYDYVTVVVGSAPLPSVALKANGADDLLVVKVGDPVVLAWTSQNANTCALSPGNFSGLNSSQTIQNMTQTTVFSVICSGAGGTVIDTVVVHVNTGGITEKKIPVVDLKVNQSDGPLELAKGSAATVTWTSTDASECYVQPGNHVGKSGTVSVNSIDKQTIFALNCYGPGGAAIDMVTVRTTTLNTDPRTPKPTADLKVNGADGPLRISKGDSITLSWWSTSATACQILPTQLTGTSGNQVVTNVQQTTVYLLKCTGAGGDFIDQVTVNVDISNLAPQPDLKANASDGPLDIMLGENVRATWTSTYASECTLFPSGTKGVTGDLNLGALSQTTALLLYCTGTGGTTVDTVIVNIHKPAPLKLSCRIYIHRNQNHACGPNRYEHWYVWLKDPPPQLVNGTAPATSDSPATISGTYGLDRDSCAGGKQTPMPLTYTYLGYTYNLWTNGSAGSNDCQVYTTTFSPLIVSFTTNRINLSAPNSGPLFDLGNDGTKARYSWPQEGDLHMFLVYDKNGNGMIESVDEMFGNATKGPDLKTATNGFLTLAKYDANRDSMINALDPIFGQLKLWADKDSDGTVDGGELMTLQQKGVRSISLKFQNQVLRLDFYGNEAKESSTVTMASGKSFPIIDYWFIPGDTK